MSDTTAKQQIVDKIKNSTNILVTVSDNPSVDELSAALGLTLLLNKMKKHATAVFSGEIPPAISFMEPAKTFENTVDSLRDFIIALDKEKADHLRYKVEGDVVKIFITPYRTTITADDLDFSQGDYNVELVLALGVKRQGSLDKALEAHGQILDDATVATIIAGSEKSGLGSIGWQESSASCLSEMLVNLSEALKVDKTLFDEQIATAFLSGIVAATERFSNNRTSARVMTMAAQLMGAGANQQLIASKFEEAGEEGGGYQADPAPVDQPIEPAQDAPVEEGTDTAHNSDGTTDLSEGESTKLEREEAQASADAAPEAPKDESLGTLNVPHEKEGTLEEVAEQTMTEEQVKAAQAAEAAVNAAQSASTSAQAINDTLPPVMATTEEANPLDSGAPQLQGAVSLEQISAQEPIYGGTLNATTEAAAEEARRLEEDDRNKTILNHNGGYIADQIPTYNAPINAASQPPQVEEMVNPLQEQNSVPTAIASTIQPSSPTLQELDDQNRAVNPTELPPLPDFSTLPPLPPMPPIDPQAGGQPVEKLGDILPPTMPVQEPSAPADPAQFRIPGQN